MLTIRGVELRNRIVVPPIHQYSAVKDFRTDWRLMNPGKFAMAALKLGVELPFRNVPPQFGYWLGTQPSTWQNGLNETRKVL